MTADPTETDGKFVSAEEAPKVNRKRIEASCPCGDSKEELEFQAHIAKYGGRACYDEGYHCSRHNPCCHCGTSKATPPPAEHGDLISKHEAIEALEAVIENPMAGSVRTNSTSKEQIYRTGFRDATNVIRALSTPPSGDDT